MGKPQGINLIGLAGAVSVMDTTTSPDRPTSLSKEMTGISGSIGGDKESTAAETKVITGQAASINRGWLP